MGGEPMHSEGIYDLLSSLRYGTYFKIWLYTSYEIDEIPLEIKELCDFIKTGRYDCTRKLEGERLSSSNQKIYKNMGDGNYEVYYAVGE